MGRRWRLRAGARPDVGPRGAPDLAGLLDASRALASRGADVSATVSQRSAVGHESRAVAHVLLQPRVAIFVDRAIASQQAAALSRVLPAAGAAAPGGDARADAARAGGASRRAAIVAQQRAGKPAARRLTAWLMPSRSI